MESFIQCKGAQGGITASESVSGQIKSSKGTGQQLSEITRSFMESRFGTDFSHVKVHNDANAQEISQDLNAIAFTHGSDIYFNRGEYDPLSDRGMKLVAHELTHVGQQSNLSSFAHIQRQQHAGSSSCPTFVSFTIRVQTPAISECRTRCRMGIGCCTIPRGQCGATHTGAVFEGKIRAPQGCSGELAFMQNLLTMDRRRTFNGSNQYELFSHAQRDGGVPWKSCTVAVNRAGDHTITSEDCPNIVLEDNMSSASAHDTFRTFLLWKPAGDNLRHPIANATWGWSAAARRQPHATDNCTRQWRISHPLKTDGNGFGINQYAGDITRSSEYEMGSVSHTLI